MSEESTPVAESSAVPEVDPGDAGAMLDPEAGDRLEAEDRKKPIPGGEPDCPKCGTKLTRRVERYPAPSGGSSPFRVRLVCPNSACGAWTVYPW
jgi:hypothetical protein